MADEMAWKNLGPNPSRKEILACWNPEDAGFWEKYGKRIATQNLYTSTWALVLSFVAWTLWATIAAKLKFIGFNFSDFHARGAARSCRRDGTPVLHVSAGADWRQELHFHHDGASSAAALRLGSRSAGSHNVV